MSILLFFIVLFALVIVHEFGHFIVAKRMGMRVDEFGVGFPPKLFGKKKGETEYTLNALPIGGFVRIYGEDAVAVAADSADAPRAFVNRPRLAQAAVLVAGVTANILFAWFLFTAVLTYGTQSVVAEADATTAASLTVLSVIPGSPAEEAGLRQGDVILSVGSAGAEGFAAPATLVPTSVSAFITTEETIAFTVSRDGRTEEIRVSPVAGLAGDDAERRVAGIVMGLVETTSLPLHLAAIEAAKLTVFGLRDITIGISTLLYDAIRFDADFSQVAGPVGIVGLVGDAASFGFASLLTFTAFISLNLAIINLLPFPALDGGRLLFVAIEAIRGVPIAPRAAYALNAAGFGLLMLLMLAVTYNDILRLL